MSLFTVTEYLCARRGKGQDWHYFCLLYLEILDTNSEIAYPLQRPKHTEIKCKTISGGRSNKRF